MMKRRITIFTLCCISAALTAGKLWAQARAGLDDSEYQAYVDLQSRSTSFDEKEQAVALFKQNYAEKHSSGILNAVTDLLKFRYDVPNFREDNNAMFYDDRIAEELIRILADAKDPRGFEVLVTYVSKRNHRMATINTAWSAIKNIDWSLDGANQTE